MEDTEGKVTLNVGGIVIEYDSVVDLLNAIRVNWNADTVVLQFLKKVRWVSRYSRNLTPSDLQKGEIE